MRKFTMITAAVFIAGVLLVGIGAGVCVEEYTTLEYSGEHIIGEEYIRTDVLEITVEPEEGKNVVIGNGYRLKGIEYDESVPAYTARYEITYNSRMTEPYLYYEDYHNEEHPGVIFLNYHYKDSGFGILMENKDRIIEELKENKIGSYRIEDIVSVRVLINPSMKEFFGGGDQFVYISEN